MYIILFGCGVFSEQNRQKSVRRSVFLLIQHSKSVPYIVKNALIQTAFSAILSTGLVMLLYLHRHLELYQQPIESNRLHRMLNPFEGIHNRSNFLLIRRLLNIEIY